MATKLTPAQIEQCKRSAKRAKKLSGKTHMDELDNIARMHGYAHWKALMKANPAT
jgi:hypothetical protein